MNKIISSFIPCAQDLKTIKNYLPDSLKTHPQISMITDVLCRKENHHIFLTGTSSQKTTQAILTAVVSVAQEKQNVLSQSDFIYLNSNHFHLITEKEKLANDLIHYNETLAQTNRHVVLILNELDPTCHVTKLFFHYLNENRWRFIILGNQNNLYRFVNITLASLTESQSLALLKTYKDELENYHHVVIPDDVCSSAWTMTKHYLSSSSVLDRAYDLLDSAAAHTSTLEKNDSKPVVTNMTLSSVISHWSQIPLTHLHNNNFQASKFIEAMQRQVIGQDAALSFMASILQQSYLKLYKKQGSLTNFLLVGPTESGKNTLSISMAEHLYGNKHALLRVNLNEDYHSFSEIKIICDENYNKNLLEAVQQTPYAIIFLENIHLSPATYKLFHSVLIHGHAFDKQGNKCDFSHTIILMTTTLVSERIAALIQTPTANDSNKTLDLMQLVLNIHPDEPHPTTHPHLSTQELCDELLPSLEDFFTQSILPHLNVVPFVPLDYAALEKIIKFKVKTFAKTLETNYEIELNYAPEIIKFLAHEALWRKSNYKTLEKLLEQHLYSPVANEILAQTEDKNRTKRLLLQLNEQGQLLRCEFLTNAYLF